MNWPQWSMSSAERCRCEMSLMLVLTFYHDLEEENASDCPSYFRIQ